MVALAVSPNCVSRCVSLPTGEKQGKSENFAGIGDRKRPDHSLLLGIGANSLRGITWKFQTRTEKNKISILVGQFQPLSNPHSAIRLQSHTSLDNERQPIQRLLQRSELQPCAPTEPSPNRNAPIY
jgi:hypothetical protein